MKRCLSAVPPFLLFALLLVLPAQAHPLLLLPGNGITRQAELRLLVSDVHTAVDRIQRIVTTQYGVIENYEDWSETHFRQNYLYATLRIRLPAERFDKALLSLRRGNLDILEHVISGRDLNQDLAELLSQRSYLLTQQARLAVLVAAADDDSDKSLAGSALLTVQNDLADIDTNLFELRQAMQEATIIVHLEPFIPTPTPTVTLTPSPTKTPKPWNPGSTYQDAISIRQEIFSMPWLLACIYTAVLLPVGIALVIILRQNKSGTKGEYYYTRRKN